MSKRIEYLDSLRGLAAASVVVDHSFAIFPVLHSAWEGRPVTNPFVWALTYTPLHLLWAGDEAVILFFVLSGFVLALPYFNGREPFYPSYLVRRFFRIYVPYILVVSFSAVLLLFSLSRHPVFGISDWFSFMWSHAINYKEYLKLILMIGRPNNVDDPAWSLAYEMRISIFFPLICMMVLRLNRWTAIGLGIVLNELSRAASFHFPNLEPLTSTLYFSSFFIIGCVLAKYKEDVKMFLEKFKPWQKLLLVLAALAFYNIVWELGALQYFGLIFKHDKFIRALGPGIGSVLIISSALSFKKFQRALHHKIFLWIGKVSYSLYLIHLVVLAAAIYFLPASIPLLGRVIFGACLSFPAAALSYQFLELPCINIGHYLVIKLNSKKSSELGKSPVVGLLEQS
jgi:peptidoglycan/LPS O-acetylase OafA/YrhL